MKSKILIMLTLVISLFFLGCTVNILEEFSKKNTDEAIMGEITVLTDANNYTGALALFSTLSAAYLALRTTQFEKARIEASICGVNFFSMVETLGIDLAASKGLIQSLMEQFTTSTQTEIDACVAAETTLKGIGVASARTDEENWLMTFVSFGKIGAVVSFEADTDLNNVIDPAYNYCSTPTDAHIDEVVTAFYNLDKSLEELVNSSGGSSAFAVLLGALITTVSPVGLCATILLADGSCTHSTTATVDAAARKGAKAAIGSDEVIAASGIFLGINDIGDCGGTAQFSDCRVACP